MEERQRTTDRGREKHEDRVEEWKQRSDGDKDKVTTASDEGQEAATEQKMRGREQERGEGRKSEQRGRIDRDEE